MKILHTKHMVTVSDGTGDGFGDVNIGTKGAEIFLVNVGTASEPFFRAKRRDGAEVHNTVVIPRHRFVALEFEGDNVIVRIDTTSTRGPSDA